MFLAGLKEKLAQWAMAFKQQTLRPRARFAMKHRFLAFVLFATWLPATYAKPGPHEPFEVTGSAIKNPDGDTIKLQTAERGIFYVRLSGADTPETTQANWKAARSHLRDMVSGKPVTAWCYKTDRYEREVCHVSVAGTDVGLSLIQHGYAWYAFQYVSELTPAMRHGYPEVEELARQQRLGLWQEPSPMPPWDCRKLKKAQQKCR